MPRYVPMVLLVRLRMTRHSHKGRREMVFPNTNTIPGNLADCTTYYTADGSGISSMTSRSASSPVLLNSTYLGPRRPVTPSGASTTIAGATPSQVSRTKPSGAPKLSPGAKAGLDIGAFVGFCLVVSAILLLIRWILKETRR